MSNAEPQATAAQKQEASQLVKKAIAQSQAGDHEAAIELYLDAYAIVPQPILLSNVGSEFQEAGRPAEALRYFCLYLTKDPQGTNASYALERAKALHAELGHDPAAEACAVTSAQAQPTPDLTHHEKPKAVAEETAEVRVDAAPSADRSRPGRTLKVVGLGITTLGLASVGVGVYYGLKAKSQSDLVSEYNETMSWPQNFEEIQAKGQSYENKQVIFTIAGGVGLATGIVTYFIGRSRQSAAEPAISLVPTSSAGSFGLAVRGGF